MNQTQTEQYLKSTLAALNALRYEAAGKVTDIRWCGYDYGQDPAPQADAGAWPLFHADETWGGSDLHFCFDAVVSAPEQAVGKKLVLRLNTGATDIWNTDNPQIFVYLNGSLCAAMDMNHHELTLSEAAGAGETYAVRFYAYSNYSQKTNFFHLTLHTVDPIAQKAYYDFKVPLEAALLLRDDDERKALLYSILMQTALRMELQNGCTDRGESLASACTFLSEALERHRGESVCEVYSIGHTHIDVAWKWPLRQTREKAARSFQTVLSLMKAYPEYLFMSSQPQLYQFVKEDRPELYAQIKERVREGRWETEGAMWLEADCNLSSGESLIRHILHGKRFFREEFGCEDNVVLWLPDVFGYSAALPQIMQKTGLRYFMTTKIGWNDTNQFPYDTLYWEGIDGSRVLSHFITTRSYVPYPELCRSHNSSTTYNGLENASQIMGTWQRYQNKSISRKVLTCYGYGDGGGGTTPEMIEEGRRLQKGILNLPKVRFSKVRDFFEDLEQEVSGKDVPLWCGELYLEFHRGTYTSMAAVKQKNRQCEFLLLNTEALAALALSQNAQAALPSLDAAWKLLLLNQFHDILPGSSIEEVYTQAAADYAQLEDICARVCTDLMTQLSSPLGFTPCAPEKADCMVLFNPLGLADSFAVELPAGLALDEPAQYLQHTAQGTALYLVENAGAKSLTKLAVVPSDVPAPQTAPTERDAIALETDFYCITVTQTGTLVRLYDKEHERELFSAEAPGNCLKIYDDRPYEFDSWNIDASYALKHFLPQAKTKARLVENGPYRYVVRVCNTYRSSTIWQDIVFYQDKRRIDFHTRIDWQEHQHLLKAEFPFRLFARKVTADIQFGNVERATHRNTTYEQAQFEMCAHKWVDCSENGYGAALLNDSKYGYSAEGATVALTLLKSGIFPNANADIGTHAFCYSLYPHSGDFHTGQVAQEAYRINCKPLCFFGSDTAPAQALPRLSISQENIFCETVKPAENGRGIVLRMYEGYGRESHVCWQYGTGYDVSECDMLEQVLHPVTTDAQGAHCRFRPYEIKTFLLTPRV